MCQFLCGHEFPTPLGKYKGSSTRVQWYDKSMFSFIRDCQAVCQSGHNHFVFLPIKNESFCCCTSLPTFGVVNVLDFGHSDRCAVVSHGCFQLHFLNDICGTSFHMLVCHLWWSVCSGLLPIFKSVICFLIVDFKSSLYILDNCPLSAMSFVNIFFQSEACSPWCIFSNSLWIGNMLGIVYNQQLFSHLHIPVCMCVLSNVRLCEPMDCSPPGSSVHRISQAEYWSVLPFPNPRITPKSPESPALAGRFFTTGATWEAPTYT